MGAVSTQSTAQVLFVTVDEPRLRFDVVLMEPLAWGGQHLRSGSPISISFDIDQAEHRVRVTAMARAWAAALASVELSVTEDEGRQLVVMTDRDQRLVLSMVPSW